MFNNSLLILSFKGSPARVTRYQATDAPDCSKTKSGECGEPLSQGDCGAGEWLVLGEDGDLECQKIVCDPKQVLVDGECLENTSVCTRSGNQN